MFTLHCSIVFVWLGLVCHINGPGEWKRIVSGAAKETGNRWTEPFVPNRQLDASTLCSRGGESGHQRVQVVFLSSFNWATNRPSIHPFDQTIWSCQVNLAAIVVDNCTLPSADYCQCQWPISVLYQIESPSQWHQSQAVSSRSPFLQYSQLAPFIMYNQLVTGLILAIVCICLESVTPVSSHHVSFSDQNYQSLSHVIAR